VHILLYVVQLLLKTRCQNINGLLDASVFVHKDQKLCVQIIHVNGNHWITITTLTLIVTLLFMILYMQATKMLLARLDPMERIEDHNCITNKVALMIGACFQQLTVLHWLMIRILPYLYTIKTLQDHYLENKRWIVFPYLETEELALLDMITACGLCVQMPK